MPVLDCSVKTCYYNKDERCCRDDIQVEGRRASKSDSTACGSFREKAQETFMNACECEKGPSTELHVDCEAKKCTFNHEEKCKADRIGIDGSKAKNSSETACGSFREE